MIGAIFVIKVCAVLAALATLVCAFEDDWEAAALGGSLTAGLVVLPWAVNS